MKMEITETNFCTALLEAADPEKKMLDIVDRKFRFRFETSTFLEWRLNSIDCHESLAWIIMDRVEKILKFLFHTILN